MTICSECGNKKAVVKGMCPTCYQRNRRKDNPGIDSNASKKYYLKNADKIKQKNREWSEQNSDKVKQFVRKSQRKRNEKRWHDNPELKNEDFDKLHKSHICNLVKKHHDEMKDDPEHLTTEFMQQIIGVDCDD